MPALDPTSALLGRLEAGQISLASDGRRREVMIEGLARQLQDRLVELGERQAAWQREFDRKNDARHESNSARLDGIETKLRNMDIETLARAKVRRQRVRLMKWALALLSALAVFAAPFWAALVQAWRGH